MIARYTLFYAALLIALNTLIVTIFLVFDLAGGSGLSSVVAIVSAMVIGRVFAKEQQRPASRRELQQLSATFTATALGLSALMLTALGLIFLEGDAITMVIRSSTETYIIAVIVIVVGSLLQYGCSYLGLHLGIKAVQKQQLAERRKSEGGQ